MNPIAIMQMAMLYFKLNAGQSNEAKAILQEGMDVITVLSEAMKDNKITMAEKKALVSTKDNLCRWYCGIFVLLL